MQNWTEASDEVKEFISKYDKEMGKMITEYIKEENIKRWVFFKAERDKEPFAVFEQYFDMSFFNAGMVER